MSDIRTRPATKEYRDNFPKVFGAKKKRKPRRGFPTMEEFQHRMRQTNAAILRDLERAATSADIRRRLKEST